MFTTPKMGFNAVVLKLTYFLISVTQLPGYSRLAGAASVKRFQTCLQFPDTRMAATTHLLVSALLVLVLSSGSGRAEEQQSGWAVLLLFHNPGQNRQL